MNASTQKIAIAQDRRAIHDGTKLRIGQMLPEMLCLTVSACMADVETQPNEQLFHRRCRKQESPLNMGPGRFQGCNEAYERAGQL